MLEKLTCLKMRAQLMWNDFKNEERGDVNIVSIVVLIGIAVVLAVVFKDAIGNLIKTLLNGIADNAKNATSSI